MRQSAITVTIVTLCCSLIGCVYFPQLRTSTSTSTPEPVEEFPALVNIKKIFITDLGNQEYAGVVREKIRLRLMKSIRFSVVEVPENADAILTGVAGVESSIHGSKGDINTRIAGIGILRLIDVKTKESIWTFEYERGFMLGGSVSSRVADQTVDKLLEDTTRADSRKLNEQPSGSKKELK